MVTYVSLSFAGTRYKIITSGSCVSNAMRAVITKDECTFAAFFLDLKDKKLSVTNTNTPRPHGCYWSSGKYLWFATHASNVNKGAETSTNTISRHPICAYTNPPSTSKRNIEKCIYFCAGPEQTSTTP